MSTTQFIQSEADFMSLFNQLISPSDCRKLAKAYRRTAAGAPPKLKDADLIAGLVFHVCQDAGVLSEHVRQLTGKRFSDSSLSERRQTMNWPLWIAMVSHACGRPLAEKTQHPGAFYKGWRLIGMDGSNWNVANTPPIKKQARKTKSRRHAAAFHRLGGTVLYELGLHNPIAARFGLDGESELALAAELWPLLQNDWLLIADRYYGVGKVAGILCHLESKPAFLLRIRKNLKATIVKVLRDGSALVAVIDPETGRPLLLREIRARVRRRSGQWVTIRLWTNLLDDKAYPAKELVQLYAMRWEQEIAFKELKIELKRDLLLLSHTLCTAAQEVAALIMAQAIIVRARVATSDFGHVPVLHISFIKTLQAFRALWMTFAVADDLLPRRTRQVIVHRMLQMLVSQKSPPRRSRSCPRAVRQPIHKWPRLLRNTSSSGRFSYKIIALKL
jgi:hypothetical protein